MLKGVAFCSYFSGSVANAMFRFLFFLLALIPAWESALIQPQGDAGEGGHLLVAVHMDGEGFRCPFLTPQFIDVLDTRAHWSLIQPTESTVRFAVDLDEAWTQEGLHQVLTAIGYPKGGASIAQWDTLAVIPPIPEE